MSSTATPLVPIVAVSAAIPLLLALRGQSLSEIPSAVMRTLSLDGTGSVWKILAVIFALLNIKSLPFVWHLRVFSALGQHFYIQPKKPSPSILFKTHILRSRSPAFECDYNIHKSNSTYFSDLDVSRTHVVASVLRHAIVETARLTELPDPSSSGASNSTIPAKGKFAIALGAVAAVFRAEIQPYQAYEIRSRVLTWDRKWVYIISHFVQARPRPTLLSKIFGGGGRRGSKSASSSSSSSSSAAEKPPKIYASAIGKYVLKRGRLTVPPELVLSKGGLLPPKPADFPSSSSSSSPSPISSALSVPSGASQTPSSLSSSLPSASASPATPAEASAESSTSNLNGAVEGAVFQLSTEGAEAVLDDSLEPAPTSSRQEFADESKPAGKANAEEWTYARIEAERVRGLRVVEAFAALDALQHVDVDFS
ncbi:hypothetical protein L228DRAFT_178230 [Xylona heveae TC161]|uniref:4HBT like protein n=1 Tax=Xylona heveae (strain CBS 132557 / TC161) TaxID=1328760 RepID=A0A165F9K2_XYLHT|nr:hypothetical protein L228DRAFT_178230 [Xylona heveae TC161]KZF20739.1 hypothetical protein L228DRAFT_178230 [Xylona heveae TC161]